MSVSGFKLFTRDTARVVFGSLHLHRWAFDTELVYISQLLGIPMSVSKQSVVFPAGAGEPAMSLQLLGARFVSAPVKGHEGGTWA